jgi:quinol monooxygenase YgiN
MAQVSRPLKAARAHLRIVRLLIAPWYSAVMISREWACRCIPENADRYEELLLTRILPELDTVDGCLGAYVFRREADSEIEFVVLHLFDSLATVRAFAGEDYEAAVIPAAARALLTSFDSTARHYDVRAIPAGDPAEQPR